MLTFFRAWYQLSASFVSLVTLHPSPQIMFDSSYTFFEISSLRCWNQSTLQFGSGILRIMRVVPRLHCQWSDAPPSVLINSGIPVHKVFNMRSLSTVGSKSDVVVTTVVGGIVVLAMAVVVVASLGSFDDEPAPQLVKRIGPQMANIDNNLRITK